MAICQNCGAQLTCSCQQRTTSDGKPACQNCIAFYEQDLVQAKSIQQQVDNNITNIPSIPDILLNS